MIDTIKTYNLRKKLNLIARELGKLLYYQDYGDSNVYEDDRIVIACKPSERRIFKFVVVSVKTLKLNDDVTEVFFFFDGEAIINRDGKWKKYIDSLYAKAVEAQKDRITKEKQEAEAKQNRRFEPVEDSHLFNNV